MAKLKVMSWWKDLILPSWKLIKSVQHADEVPVKIPAYGVVLVGNHHHPKWLVFDCPCKLGHRIMLNLESSRFPAWQFATKPRLSIWPSVDYQGPTYRCHYLISKGRVIWVNSEEQEV